MHDRPPESVDVDRLYGAADLDELRREYDRIAGVYDDDLDWRAPELLASVAARLVEHDSAVLDVGAGTGRVGVLLREAGFAVVDALDISEGMLEQARRTGAYRSLRTGTLGERLELADGAYDAVVACGVFTTGHAPAACLSEICRVTRPGGRVVFTLREDLPVSGYAEEIERLERERIWALLERGDLFASMPKNHPEVRNRIWAFGVC